MVKRSHIVEGIVSSVGRNHQKWTKTGEGERKLLLSKNMASNTWKFDLNFSKLFVL